MKANYMNWRNVALATVIGSVLAGCSTPASQTVGSASQGMVPAAGTGVAPSVSPDLYGNLPGIPGIVKTAPEADTKLFRGDAMRVASRYGGRRADPFALKASEKQYEIDQETARVMGTLGGWSATMYTPPVERDPNAGLIHEPQPYRRLSGIIVGESVYALLDNGSGAPILIKPGMKVPNTEWTVVSIDEEKAVLRRSGNKLPRQITVRLESPPAGMGGGFGNPGSQQGAGGQGTAPGPGTGQPGSFGGSRNGGAGGGSMGAGE